MCKIYFVFAEKLEDLLKSTTECLDSTKDNLRKAQGTSHYWQAERSM